MKIICAEVGQEIYAPNENGVIVFPLSAIGKTAKLTVELDEPIIDGQINGYTQLRGVFQGDSFELPPQQTDPVWNGAV
jgi:hypothetical protein